MEEGETDNESRRDSDGQVKICIDFKAGIKPATIVGVQLQTLALQWDFWFFKEPSHVMWSKIQNIFISIRFDWLMWKVQLKSETL